MSVDDSSDEDTRVRIGNVPISWYDNSPFLGYDINGKPVPKVLGSDQLEKHIQKSEDPEWWRTIVDHLNSKKVRITDEMLEIITKVRKRQPIGKDFDPFSEFDLSAPKQEFGLGTDVLPPKRRFQPSKWEQKKVRMIAKAIEKGWIKTEKIEKPEVWDVWTEETNDDKPPPPKWKLPGHIESYNPPAEYLFNEQEQKEWEEKDPMNRDIPYVPQKYSALRKVPAYDQIIKERFDRCLDLFIAPRVVRPKININPESLIPQLPDPENFRPFPEKLELRYQDHDFPISSIDFYYNGEYLASGDTSGVVKIWEVTTGKCLETVQFKKKIECVSWNPVLPVLSICSGKNIYLQSFNSSEKYEIPNAESKDTKYATWKWKDGNIKIKLRKIVSYLCWHGKGNYFSSLCKREAVSSKVIVHSLSKFQSNKIFSRQSKGNVRSMAFHPKRPLFFVATDKNIMVYNLKQQLLVKKFKGLECPVHITIHVSGEHILAACEDCKLLWYDYDLSSAPYKTFPFHKKQLTYVHTHRRYPLLATSGLDKTVHVFHAQVYQDYLQQPLVVPLRSLKTQHVPVQCLFHPKQPWLATIEDKEICLYI
jgi:ribosome biogenesis protein ERB1